MTMQNVGLLCASTLLVVISFIDDRTPLPWWVRLLVQVGIALLIFLTGTRIYSLTNPLEALTGHAVIPLDTFVVISETLSNPSILGALFTVVWLFLTINALNWFDGIPGQVSVLSTISFVTIGFLAFSSRVNQPALALLAFVLAAMAGATLFFHFPPPKALMGDTGAMFFGLMLGVLTIYAGGKVATGFLVLGVPLIDFVLVIVQRLLRGQSIVRGSMTGEHLHHRLLAKGWSERQVIALTALLGSAFGITALFLSTFGKLVAALILVVIMMGLFVYSRPR
jgi:UDP-GlcNAc:undecaprenyl-phosphate GlcNAc-1-phosphate transferase